MGTGPSGAAEREHGRIKPLRLQLGKDDAPGATNKPDLAHPAKPREPSRWWHHDERLPELRTGHVLARADSEPLDRQVFHAGNLAR